MCSVLLIQKASILLARSMPVLIVTWFCCSCVHFKIKSAFARLYRNNGFGKGKEEQ